MTIRDLSWLAAGLAAGVITLAAWAILADRQQRRRWR